MKKSKTGTGSLFLLLAFISVFLLNSCGYTLHRYADLPFKEIKIGLIENKTLEPKLQDKLHKALTEEFLKQGISVDPDANLKLTVIIHRFTLDNLSEKQGVTIEYKVNIVADIILTDKEGKTNYTRNISSPFMVPMSGSSDFGNLLANKDIAVTRALNDVAMQIVGALIYK